jgi:hypothetical protein
MKRSSIYYIFDELTVYTWLASGFPDLFRKRFNGCKSDIVVYFIDGTRSGIFIAGIMSWLVRCNVEKLEFRLVDIRDDQGVLVRLRIPFCGDLAGVVEQIIASPSFAGLLQEDAIDGRMSAYLYKQVADIGMITRGSRNSIAYILFLVQIIFCKVVREADDIEECILYTDDKPWIWVIQEYASRHGIRIKPFGRGRGWSPASCKDKLIGAFPPFMRQLLIVLVDLIRFRRLRDWRQLLILLFAKLARKSNVAKAASPQSVESGRYRIAVEYYGQLNISRPDLHSDLFFWQQSNLEGADILLTVSIPSDPLDEGTYAALKENAISVVALNPMAAGGVQVPVYRGAVAAKVKRLAHCTKMFDRLERQFVDQQIQRYYASCDYWSGLFHRYQIRLYVTWFKFSAEHCAIADVMERLGGITAIYQRAVDVLPNPETMVATDIVFGFNREGADLERQSNSLISYYVTTGYLGDFRFPLLKKQALEVRKKLHGNGAKRIVSYFDENSSDDSRWHTGHEFMKDNYCFLLEKVMEDPSIGLVLKPKNPLTLRQRLGEVASLLEEAEKTGRCFVFEYGLIYASSPPAAAALASDIAIHGHLCAATAGIEAALAGVPTLLMDREGWGVSYLNCLGKDRVVFTSWEAAWKRCEEYWRSPGSGIGDWSPVMDQLDPFRDGRAAERMGNYLKWLIDGLNAGESRDAVMADAAERYAKAWGHDKVTEVRPNNRSLNIR